jgi:beta-glucosidase
MAFPQDFVWGAATSSYQIEGAAREDGRGECIWTRFSHTPGNVVNGDTGDVACDHYHHYQGDVALMQALGIKAYRFSISWPRVIPGGTGAVNPAGLDFYDRLVDALLEADISPYIALYHWDLPQALQDRGGWENHDMIDWFAGYARTVSERLGDRVKHWVTLNEPFVIAWLGHFMGVHAPGKQDMPATLKVAHHLPLAHAAAISALRETVEDVQAGIILDYAHCEAASPTEEDEIASHYFDYFHNRWFFDPVLLGCYPQDIMSQFGPALDGIDLDEISAAAVPIDFLGLNYYTRTVVKAADKNALAPFEQVRPEDEGEYTEMDWEVYPDGIRQMLLRVNRDYAPKALYITENGAAFNDPAPLDGQVHDPRRVAYLNAHLKACEAAITEGVPLKGYFVWSLLDNFEWSYGFSKRFGIFHVDYDSLDRSWKDSARYYQEVIRANAV